MSRPASASAEVRTPPGAPEAEASADGVSVMPGTLPNRPPDVFGRIVGVRSDDIAYSRCVPSQVWIRSATASHPGSSIMS